MGTQGLIISILGGRSLVVHGRGHARGLCDDHGPGRDDRDQLAIGRDLTRLRGRGLGRAGLWEGRRRRDRHTRGSRGIRAAMDRAGTEPATAAPKVISRASLGWGGHGRVGLGVSTRACVRNPQPGHRVVPRDRNPAARDIDGRAGPIIRSHHPRQGLGHGWVGFGRVRVRSRGTRLPQGITTGGAHVYSLGRRGRSLGRGTPGRRARPILGALFAPIWTRHGCARGRGEPGAKVELRQGS